MSSPLAKNRLTTYCIWTTWNYLGKHTKVLIHWYRLLEYLTPTHMHRVWNSNVLILKRGIKHGNSDIMLPNDLKIFLIKGRWELQYLKNNWVKDIEEISRNWNWKKKLKLNTLGAPEKFLSQNSVVEISSKL